MSTPKRDPNPLAPYYEDALAAAREFVTLRKIAESHGADESRADLRGQIRQQLDAWEEVGGPTRKWLLIEVLVCALADTFDDLEDWSNAVLAALQAEGGEEL